MLFIQSFDPLGQTASSTSEYSLFVQSQQATSMGLTKNKSLTNERSLVLLRNGGAINKLPGEVLAFIFCALRDLYSPFILPDPQASERISHDAICDMFLWVNIVTLVSKLWHDVACNCPQLWTHVEIGSGQHFRPMELSKAASLTAIFIPEAPPIFRRTVEALPRAQSLYAFTSRQFMTAFKGITDMSRLERLTLATALPWDNPDAALPDTFVTGELPRLKAVDISCIPFRWSDAIFSPNLRKLRISTATDADAPTVLTVTETLNALAGMPRLEELELGGLRRIPSDVGYRPPSVFLRHLRSLSVHGYITGCVHLLIFLVYSPRATTNITCHLHPRIEWRHAVVLAGVLRDRLLWAEKKPMFEKIKYVFAEEHTDALRTEYHLHCGGLPRGVCLENGDLDGLAEIWKPRYTDGLHVTLVPFSNQDDDEPRPGPLPRDWARQFCTGWPLQDVEVVSLGHGRVSIEDVRSLCPNISVLALALEDEKGSFTVRRLMHTMGFNLLEKPTPRPTLATLIVQVTGSADESVLVDDLQVLERHLRLLNRLFPSGFRGLEIFSYSDKSRLQVVQRAVVEFTRSLAELDVAARLMVGN